MTDDKSLKDKIHDSLVIDELDDELLTEALRGAIGVTREYHEVKPLSRLEERKNRDRIASYLLGKYAAKELADRAVSLSATKHEIVTQCDVSEDVLESFLDNTDEFLVDGEDVELNGTKLQHVAERLVRRYV